MNFIKVGDRYINLDSVTYIRDRGATVSVGFNYTGSNECLNWAELKGADAATLLNWLDLVSTDLAAMPTKGGQ
jgi:hypothetical protein